MKSETLKGKRKDRKVGIGIDNTQVLAGYCFNDNDLESAVRGLIKFHEDRIEKLIKKMRRVGHKYSEDYFVSIIYEEFEYLERIEQEYESIMAIEHWLEDVI